MHTRTRYAGWADMRCHLARLAIARGSEVAAKLYRRLGLVAVPSPEPVPGKEQFIYIVASAWDIDG